MTPTICYLLPRILPTSGGSVIGGAAANCVSLALELKRRGVGIEVLASVSDGGLVDLAGSPLSEILKPLPNCGGGLLGKGVGTVRTLRGGLRERSRETHFDIVHCHSGTYPYAVVPLVADRRATVRLHSLYCPLTAEGGVYSRWWESMLAARLAFGRLDRVVAVTQNVQRSLQTAGVPHEKTELVPMCVDTQRFRPMSRPNLTKYFHDGQAQARILFVGNASQEKGLAELLRAAKILADKKMSFFLVAAVENQSKIKEYTIGYDRAQDFVHRCGLENCVRFVGLVDAMEALYAETDFLVIPWNTSRGPSDYPMVVLEAMAMGKCIISTPVGGCPELLAGGAGILTKDFSAESIASALEATIHDARMQQNLGAVAVRRAQYFSVRISADRLMGLYEKLLRKKADYHAYCPA